MKYIILAIMLVLMMVLLSPVSAAASDENFDGAPAGDTGTQSYTLNGVTYTTNDAGALNIYIVNDGNIALGGDLALGYRSSGVNQATLATFKTSDGSEFKLNSFVISTGLGDTTVTIKGYRDNAEIASSSVNTASFTTFNVAGNSDWEYIDEVRMTGADLDVDIDDIDFSPAVLPTYYNVTYNGNTNTAGTVPVDGNVYSNGASVTVLGNTGSLVKTGYAFTAWNTAAGGSGTSYNDGATFSMGSSNVILYAQWIPIPVANFSANVTSGAVPLSVGFTDSSTNSPSTWFWDFGDGANSTIQNPTHEYSSAGTYNVSLNATNAGGSNISTQLSYITTAIAPVANFTANVTSGASPLSVGFTDSSTNSPTDWFWDFGDGTNSSTQNPTHTYSSAGTYTVSLNATNVGGSNVSTQLSYITASIVTPVASFSANVTSGTSPLSVVFTDSSTNSPTDWFWDFGDGSNSILQNPTHEYTSVGTYNVSLNASNSVGSNVSTQLSYITVADVPVANFTSNVSSGSFSLPVAFTDLSTNNPVGWAWYFGDEDLSGAWTELNSSSGWSERSSHSSVVLPDGSIVVMGGTSDGSNALNDTWRSTDNGSTWTLMNASSGWEARKAHSTVVLSDGSIVLTGGYDGSNRFRDTWKSTDKGATWTELNSDSGLGGRYWHSSVVLPDDSIVIMGGMGLIKVNDTWRSTDGGTTWTEINSSSGWSARNTHQSAVLYDGSIVLTGGSLGSGNHLNDTWRSTDNGSTWTELNSSSGWSQRRSHSMLVLPDSSIVLMGGTDDTTNLNDIWRSTDNGSTWTLINASADWPERSYHSNVVLPDGSMVLMGGYYDASTRYNDTWRLSTAGSTEQNAIHTYTDAGTYQVTLQAYNPGGYDNVIRAAYVTTAVAPVANFSSNVTSGNVPFFVNFTDSSTNSPTSWFWDFGDGTNSTSQNPIHEYSSAGTYNVSLNASNVGGSNVSTQLSYITVSGMPVANFTSNVTSGAIPLSVNFTDSSTNSPTSWFWDFGDGTNSTDQSPTYTYSSAGTYNVSLNASNAGGSNVSTQLSYITVTDVPVANFTASTESGYSPLSVVFTDNSSNSPTSWFWDFGDGENSTSQSPTHSFSAIGTYNVNLNASNLAGSNVSSNMTITVTTAPSSGSSGSSGSSSSGGGGGGSTGEAYENIVTKAVETAFVNKNSHVIYEFDVQDSPVVSVQFDSLKNSGRVQATVEVLKGRSSFATKDCPGEIYKQVNIWVGKSGFASSDNVENTQIHFKVEKSWVTENNIDPATIRMMHYYDEDWHALPTSKTGEDEEYLSFVVETSGFSPFSIVGDTIAVVEEEIAETPEQVPVVEEKPEPEPAEKGYGTMVLIAILILVVVSVAVYFYKKKDE
ncbi:PKD domain-containing protein [Methanolobus sp.]|uniref:PKD domain-containing protein n=1 Tax=Methanolobus sp. TaxID=1874737 RepID=UPI0025D07465|nr:PKD domain-containing protein [Methanolobus sp.]